MSYEIYREQMVATDEGIADRDYSTLNALITASEDATSGILMVRLSSDPDDVYVKIHTPSSDGDEEVGVKAADILDAWMRMRRLSNRGKPVMSRLSDEEQEEIARVVETACDRIVETDDPIAGQLRAAVMGLMGIARTPQVPLAAVDPEDFDQAIRAWRHQRDAGRDNEGRDIDPMTLKNRGVLPPEVCEYYIDAWQSARKNVLGETLPQDDGRPSEATLPPATTT